MPKENKEEIKDYTKVFIETHHNFHPYECGGVKENCIHCLALKNNDKKHIKKCALCEDGFYWDKPLTKQQLFRRN